MYDNRKSNNGTTALIAAVLLCIIANNLLDPLSVVRLVIALIAGIPGV